jgi:hypothetical protein
MYAEKEMLYMKKGKKLMDVVFILDRSGSMSGSESDTIGGYNSYINNFKGKNVKITTVLFDDRYEMINKRMDVNMVPKLTSKQYFVRGCTALLDAIGESIRYMESEKAKKVMFVITTDGYENASREYDYKKVRDMIKHQKEKYDWEFLFLGANIDAVGEASKFGIDASKAVKYECDSKGTELNYAVLNEAVCNVRMGNRLDASWKSKIESDYKKRHK